MKRTVAAVAVILALLACSTWLKPHAPKIPGVVVIHAQQMPVNRTLTWDANPAGDNVLNYVVRLDGVVIGSPVGITQAVTFTTTGAHTLTVVAVNAWGESAPTTLSINVVAPAQPVGLRIQ
jgi:hypothetical protein